MLTLAALTLSLATTLAPATSDPGAAPATALENAHATGEAVLGAAPHANAAPANKLTESANVGTANVGTANIGTPTISLDGSSSPAAHSGFPVGSILPLLGFALCGAAAIVFAKKKQIAPKLLQIVETHNLGGRRSLIVARIAGETLLLGSSEAGLALILARPGETVAETDASLNAHRDSQAAALAQNQPVANSQASSSWLGRLRLARSHEGAGEANDPSFEELLERDTQARNQSRARNQPTANIEPALLRQPLDPLAESAEDQELRRKLAAGRSGRIA